MSGQSHQRLAWTRGKEWHCLLGMSEGPDNYIWQSHEEWLCNVIAKNYPFNSISGCLSFSNGTTLLFCCGFPFCRAAYQPVLLFLLNLILILVHVFSFVFLLPSPVSLTLFFCTYNDPSLPCFRGIVMWGKYLPKDSISGINKLICSLRLARLLMTCVNAASAVFVLVGLRSRGKGRQWSVTTAHSFSNHAIC